MGLASEVLKTYKNEAKGPLNDLLNDFDSAFLKLKKNLGILSGGFDDKGMYKERKIKEIQDTYDKLFDLIDEVENKYKKK